eukprot:CAMPEP_0117736168 /NCGR_PEP_ID=MMETSP0947-20121206/1764_1 /TAXON_ID=44440 /ORGANISM="Chattonella subsalsa, Strain CCMP2191" /LENGTH=337 /DNA_ID=CAMNT_0005551397 /DNA_START=287 /DNA_END=1297 /DNA_ORIENTATION=+
MVRIIISVRSMQVQSIQKIVSEVFYKLNRAVSDLHSLREKHPSFTDLALSHAFGEQPICAYRPLENALHKLTLKSNRTLSEGKTEFSASFSAKVPFEWNDIFCLKPFCLLPVIDSTSKIYEEFEVEGLKVNAESGVFEKYPELHDELKKDICHNKEVLPPSAWNVINSNTCLWLNDTMQYGPKRNPTFGRGMCVHPGKNWLVENGMSPKKLNGIEIYSAREYLEERKKYPLYLLHEMAHVFHLHYPEGGYDNKEIIQVYDAAMRSGCYEKVTLRGHDQDVFFKAYACENQMEYFAEISTAFFSEKESDRSGNKWSPYTKSELKQIDTEGFELCNKVW